MKLQLSILVRGFIASVVSLSTWAQPETTHVRLGSGSETHEFNRIRVENVQEESLGRIRDPSIDPISDRIVELLVASDNSLDVGSKIVAVSPRALISDPLSGVYQLTVRTSGDEFTTRFGMREFKWWTWWKPISSTAN